MSLFPCDLDPVAPEALGLIVLQTDETVESDFRRLFPDPASRLYVSRIAANAQLTPGTIAKMEADLPRAAGLLPVDVSFAAVGYACTSGTTLIGVDRVSDLVRGACATRAVCNPLSAAIGAFAHLGARRIALVSPYRTDVAEPVRNAFAASGLGITSAVHFGEEMEPRVARISPASVIAAARAAVMGDRPDAVFLSCTNLRTLDVIPVLEAELGLPVLGSNLALAWAMGEAHGNGMRPQGNFRLLSAQPQPA